MNKENKELIKKMKNNRVQNCLLIAEEWECLKSANKWQMYSWGSDKWIDARTCGSEINQHVYRIHPDWEPEEEPELKYGDLFHITDNSPDCPFVDLSFNDAIFEVMTINSTHIKAACVGYLNDCFWINKIRIFEKAKIKYKKCDSDILSMATFPNKKPKENLETDLEYFYGKRLDCYQGDYKYATPTVEAGMFPEQLLGIKNFIGWKFVNSDIIHNTHIMYLGKTGVTYTSALFEHLKSGERVKVVATHAVFKVDK
jgi:hypothetical protein